MVKSPTEICGRLAKNTAIDFSQIRPRFLLSWQIRCRRLVVCFASETGHDPVTKIARSSGNPKPLCSYLNLLPASIGSKLMSLRKGLRTPSCGVPLVGYAASVDTPMEEEQTFCSSRNLIQYVLFWSVLRPSSTSNTGEVRRLSKAPAMSKSTPKVNLFMHRPFSIQSLAWLMTPSTDLFFLNPN